MLPKPNFLIAAALLMTAGVPHAARAQAGWRTEVVGKKVVLTPPDLAAGEFYQVTVYPRVPLAGSPITDFLDAVAGRRVAALGRPTGGAKPAQTAGRTGATASRTFVTPQGAARGAIFIALAMDGENARIIEVVSSSDALPRYQAQADAITREMIKQEKAAALASGRGLKAEKLPTPPQGMTPGGKIVPGIYAGNSLYGDEIQESLRLYLYASGEYQLCNGKGEEVEFGSGDYHYDPVTGKMTIGNTFSLSNNDSDPNDETCLYGRAVDGKPFLYARTDEGFHYMTRVLLDVPLSRRTEPQTWGRWRRQGPQILVAWPDAPGRFVPLKGEPAIPARPGERLSGRFGAGESSGGMGFGGSYRLWGVTFTSAGRFLKDGRGGSSSGSLGATMNGFSADTMYDDEGASTSVVSPGAVVAAGTRKPGGHRGGTYSLSGYVLTLRYDDGRVVRLPFFFESATRDLIFFEGASMNLGDGK